MVIPNLLAIYGYSRLLGLLSWAVVPDGRSGTLFDWRLTAIFHPTDPIYLRHLYPRSDKAGTLFYPFDRVYYLTLVKGTCT